MHTLKKYGHFIKAGIITACCLFAGACSDTAAPPFIKAQVVDVYNNKTTIENAHFMYWWQERGETAFLDTHTHLSRILLAHEVVQHAHEGTGSELAPLRLHLKDTKRIEWVITAAGKKMFVHRQQGPVVEAASMFPQELRVSPTSGLADYKLYITGSTKKNIRTFDFKQDLDFIKTIIITGVDRQR